MLTARDELSHLADTLTEAQAERVLAAIRSWWPELYPDGDEADLPTRRDAPMAWMYFRCLTCQERGHQHIARSKEAPDHCALCGGKLWSEIDRPADARECPYCDRVYPASFGLCPFCEDR